MVEIDFSQLPTDFIYRKIIKEVDKQLFEYLMKEKGLSQSKTAEVTGLSRRTIQLKLDQHGIKK